MKQYKGYERKEQNSWEPLPKAPYVIKILDVKEEPNKEGKGTHLKIAFDIAEGEYTGFYKKAFENDTREDKKWNNDAVIYLTCPEDNSEQWVIDNFNTFITAVEDSNDGFHWSWDETTLKNKLVGAKFHNKQSEYDGNVYDHIRPKWFVAAQKVREGKAGKLPNDVLITTKNSGNNNGMDTDGFLNIPEGVDEEIPF